MEPENDEQGDGVTSQDPPVVGNAPKPNLKGRKESTETVKVHEAPDGGYSWVVLLGAFVIQGICAGILRTSSILYTQLLSHFNQSAAATSSVFAVFGIVKTFSAPLSTMLCNTFSHRAVSMVGGVLMTTGLVITAYAPSLPLVNFSHSIITGLGFGLSFTANLCIPPLYFNKRRGRAAAIAYTGGDLGAVALVAILQFFFSEFGYTGGYFLLGGVCLHICAGAALFRPLQSLQRRRMPSKMEQDSINQTTANIKNSIYEMGSTVSLGGSQAYIPDLSHENFNVKSKDCAYSKIESSQIKHGDEDIQLREQFGSTVDNGTEEAAKTSNDNNSKHKPSAVKALGSWLYVKLDLGLLKHAQFVWFGMHLLSIFAAGLATLSVISELCLEKGLTKEQVSFVLMISNAVIIPLKFITVSLFDIPVIRYHDQLVMAVSGVFFGISVVALPLATSFPALAVLFSIYLFLLLVTFSNFVNALASMLGAARITSAVGLVRPMTGVGEFIGVAMAGVIKDAMGSFSWSLWVIGGVYLLVTVLYLIRVIYWTFHVRPSYKVANKK